MADVKPSLPFDSFSGKLSRKEDIAMRTRNGRTHAYAIKNPYKGPLAESRKRAIGTFSEAVRLCKAEMADPERLAFWQDRYLQYYKAAQKNLNNANKKFLGIVNTPQFNASGILKTPKDKFYSTLRGFIIASLSRSNSSQVIDI